MPKPLIRVTRHRAPLVDYDYVEKLDEKEVLWLQTFSDEYYSGFFRKGILPVHSDGLRRDCFNRNSKINRDLNNQNTPRSLETLDTEEILAHEEGPEQEVMLKAQYGSLIDWIQSPHE